MSEFVPLSSIIVDRPNRQRREASESYIAELADSISRLGLINPIVIDENDVLVAGECRLTAVKQLGWEKVEVNRKRDLSATQLFAVELEENIKRSELPWKDECAAIARLHAMLKSENPEWSGALTAEFIGLSPAYVYDRMNVQKELEAGTDLVVNAPAYSVAKNVTARLNERRKAFDAERVENTIATIFDGPGDGGSDEASSGEVRAVSDTPSPSEPEVFVPLFNADFAEWRHDYSGPRFNFLHCDFPYGIKADKHHQGAAKMFRGYADDPDVYWALLAELAAAMDSIVAESAHLVFWYSMDYHEDTRRALESMGWKVNPFPLIWFKSDNTGISPDTTRGPRRIYETAFLASRGDRKIIQTVANAFAAPVVKTVHMSEKNPQMLRHFFRMLVDDTTVMLDPTAGSGNAVWVAEAMGANYAIGLEKDPEFHEAASRKWKESSEEIDL